MLRKLYFVEIMNSQLILTNVSHYIRWAGGGRGVNPHPPHAFLACNMPTETEIYQLRPKYTNWNGQICGKWVNIWCKLHLLKVRLHIFFFGICYFLASFQYLAWIPACNHFTFGTPRHTCSSLWNDVFCMIDAKKIIYIARIRVLKKNDRETKPL